MKKKESETPRFVIVDTKTGKILNSVDRRSANSKKRHNSNSVGGLLVFSYISMVVVVLLAETFLINAVPFFRDHFVWQAVTGLINLAFLAFTIPVWREIRCNLDSTEALAENLNYWQDQYIRAAKEPEKNGGVS